MEFITNRTEEDVFLKKEKGYYTTNDLNRVEANVATLQEMAKGIAVFVNLETKTNWGDDSDWGNKMQMVRYLQNVKVISDACGIKTRLPLNMEKLNFYGANNIEKSLEMVYNKIVNITNTFNYSGEFYAGEEFSL